MNVVEAGVGRGCVQLQFNFKGSSGLVASASAQEQNDQWGEHPTTIENQLAAEGSERHPASQ